MVAEELSNPERPRVTDELLVDALREMSLGPGMHLQVHSSLSALGYVVGGAEAVVDALLEVVGPDGTVMMPTFNHAGVDIFDPWHTPSVNGAVTEALRLRLGAKRSRHNTHPNAAIGRHADWLTAGSTMAMTFSADSPLGRLAKVDGKILLLGVGMNANTAAHVGETLAGVHCIGSMEGAMPVLTESGEVRDARCVAWRNGKCLIEWDALEDEMRRQSMIRDGQVGSCKMHLMRLIDVIDTTIQLAAKFCPTCPTQKRPARLRKGYSIGDWLGDRTEPISLG